ncbi:haloacid dehalogenase [Schizopora paradoxa]|uniref:Haloacid dehalogenase n=1 Tax=Schizopora paradoxa TaxID=27342 RepID=A0A0H2RKR1_9AGAM|nr:haloacid dehalogenase [Schizopora paradoxa]
MTSNSSSPLKGVEVFTFDVFGTVVDWLNTGIRVLKEKAKKAQDLKEVTDSDWEDFMKEWRGGYRDRTISGGLHGLGGQTLSVDVMHREILDAMLDSDRWRMLGAIWGESDRNELVMLWHKLDGWPDSSSGLKSLKEQAFIVTLSNGNVRLLADMAKHADLRWDVILSAELLGSFKPNPKVYLGAMHHLSVRPENCAMVAAHIFDLRAAASHGMKTVYVRRPTEDVDVRDSVKPKSEGGDVDVVVDGLDELAALLKAANE